MAYEFQRSCQLVETRKLVWIVGLVLASVVLVQYFELPYRDNLLSLISGGKACLSSEVGCNEENPHLKNMSQPPLVPKSDEGSVSAENAVISENDNGMMNHRSEVDTIEATMSIAPIADDARYNSSAENSDSNIAASPVDFETPISPVSAEIVERVASFLPPLIAPSQPILPIDTGVSASSPVATFRSTDLANTSGDSRNSGIVYKNNISSSDNLSFVTNRSPPPVKMPDSPVESVVSISEMYNMLLHSRVSSFSKSPQWSSAADEELLDARIQIERAAIIKDHPNLHADIYRNLSTFVRSYEIMEQKLKVYIYKDGERPVSHQPTMKGIYASEGWFMRLMESSSNQFVTSNPREAHLFYLPFSSQMLATYVYVKDSHTFNDINEYLKKYLETIKARYPFWNRTEGSDHFLVACHDWGPIETRRLMANSIRALCNSDIKEGFVFGKDVSLPETTIHDPQNPMKETGGMPPSRRKILAFFAGQMHGYVRPILLKYWENKDPGMKIVGRMRKGYAWHMKNSKYCICAKGYEVNSPRVVEAIMYGCVPVIISDNFVPPFFEVLDWDSFAVFVLETDIPDLKKVLVSISDERYVEMHKRVEHVRQHFLWHKIPVKYDIFHMILHSIWYNRVFRLQPR